MHSRGTLQFHIQVPIHETSNQASSFYRNKAINSDLDTMYQHEAMRELYQGEFVQVMQKEMHGQMDDGNFELVHQLKIPSKTHIFPAIWQM